MNALLNVINAELFKTLRKRRVFVLAGLLWVIVPILLLIVGSIVKNNLGGTFADNNEGLNINVQSTVQEIASPFGIARLMLTLPTFMSPTFYIIIIALLAALFMGEERSQNMWKTTLVAQPNRLAVLFGKFIVTFLIFGAILLGGYFSSLLFGAIGTLFLQTTFAGDWLGLFRLYLLQWLFSVAGIAFAFLMVWFIRNIALGLVSIFFLPALFEGIYSLYKTAVGFERLTQLNALFQTLRLRNTLEELPRYFFTRNLYAPAREPVNAIIKALGGDPNSSNDASQFFNNLLGTFPLGHSAQVMAVYTLIFGGFLVWRFLRRDVS
jgi:ABC-type transport system involved in multi-copper enzyme maturation permease subunit